LQRAGRYILWAIEALLGTTLLLSVVLICANAFGRYVLYRPIIWAEEILGYALVWMVYLGAIIVTNTNQHLRMDLLAQLLSKKAQSVLRLLGNIVFIAVGLLIIYQAPGSISEFKHHSQVANLPMDVVHMIIPISFVAMVVLLVGLSIDEIRYLARGADAANSEKST
jgi:TRAP-type C4-dicarboxylate transport system permease small subunit